MDMLYRILCAILSSLSLALWSTVVFADTRGFADGNLLSESCASSQVASQAWCLGYVGGVVDTMQQPFLTAGSVNAAKVCVAEGVKLTQLRDAVKLWLHEHPEKRHLAASFLVFQALKDRFPCG